MEASLNDVGGAFVLTAQKTNFDGPNKSMGFKMDAFVLVFVVAFVFGFVLYTFASSQDTCVF